MPEILNLCLRNRLLQSDEIEETLGEDPDHGSMNEIKGKRVFTKVLKINLSVGEDPT